MKFKGIAALAAAATVSSAGAWATTYTETVDAGNTLASSITLPGGTTSVEGKLEGGGDNQPADLYKFTLDADSRLTIRLLSSAFDANLLLFNSLGQGLAGNDDTIPGFTPCDTASSASLDSCISIDLLAGDYFVAASINNAYGYDADGRIMLGNDNGILPTPSLQVLSYVLGGTLYGADRDYTLTFIATGDSEVPLPAALPMFASALAGGTFLRRRKGAKA
ncbi:DVUA0089 family protein [Parvularcula sp. LCG005]|uniref:DVUA0089 family protein n=1 Tax=Parvularcula sp. LCG005 TaxID=3078805 RepID=UPI002942AD75|nr:DVUA0089 family protein [Parvularcula sp. LCG005]WOI53191.1 DVUA0089 family protein [Parvularcula sp. LCG005]